MAAIRANWKGYLKIGELSCPVALYTGASTSERVSFHTINRATGHRVRREFIDAETGDLVERDEQVKGFEVDKDSYVMVEPEEVAKAVPESNKILAVGAFIASNDIDTLYFDKPYYLAPAGPVANEAFAVIREAMRAGNVAALAHAVLFRRYRGLMIRAHGLGLVAHTLSFDYEIRSARDVFGGIPARKIQPEMLKLARHIIETKRGTFDPATFDDRYEAAIAELVKAKLAGRSVRRKKAPATAKVVDLMEALRASAGVKTRAKPAAKPAAKRSAAHQRKAG